MRADQRRRLELTRLATEITADVTVLDGVARLCLEAQPSLAKATRAITAMVAVDLHRYYTAIENVLERIERGVGALPPSGPAWHKDLLLGAARDLADARPAILSPTAVTDLEGLLAFRHFFRHAYAVEFDPTRLGDLVSRLTRVHATVAADLRRFEAHLQNTIAGMKGAE